MYRHYQVFWVCYVMDRGHFIKKSTCILPNYLSLSYSNSLYFPRKLQKRKQYRSKNPVMFHESYKHHGSLLTITATPYVSKTRKSQRVNYSKASYYLWGRGGNIGLTLFIDDAFVVKVVRYWHRYFMGAFCLWLATYLGKIFRPIS